MYPTDFEGSNYVIDKPSDMTRDECDAINAFVGTTEDGHPIFITCFKATGEELQEINKTGRVWIWHFGNTLQPHAVTGEAPLLPTDPK